MTAAASPATSAPDLRPAAATRGPAVHPPRVRMEIRKLTDTRTQRILLGLTLGLGLLLGPLIVLADGATPALGDLMSVMALPAIYLVPVVALLAQCVEWGRRGTGAVTFTLDPHRHRVVLAKVAATVVVSAVIGLVLGLLALAAIPLLGGAMPSGGAIAAHLGWYLAGFVLAGLVGSALGAACQVSGLAIVLYLVLAQLLPQLLTISSLTEPLVPYTHVLGTIGALTGGVAPLEAMPALGTIVVWVVAPLAVGLVRAGRSDVN